MAKRKLDSKAEVNTSAKRKRIEASDFEPVDPKVMPDDAHLDLADAEIYYIANFVEKGVARRWYKDLLALETCKPVSIPI